MKNYLALAAFAVLVVSSVAVVGFPTLPPPPPPTPIPIDGGLSLVIAGCVGYGAKKMYDKRKQNNEVK